MIWRFFFPLLFIAVCQFVWPSVLEHLTGVEVCIDYFKGSEHFWSMFQQTCRRDQMLKTNNNKTQKPDTIHNDEIIYYVFHKLLIQLQLVYSSHNGQFIIQLGYPPNPLHICLKKNTFSETLPVVFPCMSAPDWRPPLWRPFWLDL